MSCVVSILFCLLTRLVLSVTMFCDCGASLTSSVLFCYYCNSCKLNTYNTGSTPGTPGVRVLVLVLHGVKR